MFEESVIKNALKEENKIGGGGNGTVYRLDKQHVVKKLNISVGKKGPNDTAGSVKFFSQNSLFQRRF